MYVYLIQLPRHDYECEKPEYRPVARPRTGLGGFRGSKTVDVGGGGGWSRLPYDGIIMSVHNVYRIAGNFQGVLSFVIFGVQFQARNLKPTKISSCVLCLSAKYSSHEIKNHEN